MIAPLALGAMATGMALGYFMIRRAFLLRSWTFAVLVMVGLTVLTVTGQMAELFPAIAGPGQSAILAALLLILVPPPLAAGLLVGGATAFWVRRHDKSA